MPSEEFAVRVLFRHDHEGRCYVESPDVVGLHLAGHDIEAIKRELDPVIKDLVFHNLGRVINRIRWVPSLEDVAGKFAAATRRLDSDHAEVCVVNLTDAA